MDYIELFYKNKKVDLSNLPKILYINLERSKDRNIYIKKHFKEFNITNYERIEGEDYKNDNIKFTKSKLKSFNNGVYYCLFSHIKALKHFYENIEDENILICEDDVNFNLTYIMKKPFNDYLKNIPNDYDIVNLINHKMDNPKPFKDNTYDYWGTVIYLVSKKGAKKIIDTFEKYNYNFSNVKYVNADRFLYNSTDNYYVYGISLCGRYDNDSLIHPEQLTIHTNINNKIMDYYITIFNN